MATRQPIIIHTFRIRDDPFLKLWCVGKRFTKTRVIMYLTALGGAARVG